jgi:ZIP family zinc transporter
MVLGPVIGSSIGVIGRPSIGYIRIMMSFAAGVMLSISFLELIPESIALSSVLVGVCGVGFGAVVMYGLDRLIPHIHPQLCAQENGRNLERTSVYLILGIFLHNFPEGMAVAIGSVTEIKVSFAIALAIAIHNIPEAVCTSAPFFHTTGARWKSFFVSSSTAVPIVVGYVMARYLFQQISPAVIGFIIGATAGLMIYITADELIPNGCAGPGHQTIFALMGGIIFVIILGAI